MSQSWNQDANQSLAGSPADILWYIGPPDGPRPWRPDGRRDFDPTYARQLASVLDRLGFDGALIGTGAQDPWVLGAQLIAATERLKLLLATYPPLISPVLAAKMAQSFEYAAPGRLYLNIVNGTTDVARTMGSGLDHDARYALTEEWIPVWRAAMAGQPYDQDGVHICAHGKIERLVSPETPLPELWSAGSSEAALGLAARHIDCYLSWGEPSGILAEKFNDLSARARAHGRHPRFGVRLSVILRETDEAAWAEANDILHGVDRDLLAANMVRKAATDSVGMARMARLYDGLGFDDARQLEVAPGLWLGLGLVQFAGNAAAIVGSPETVCRVMQDYRKAGVSTFVFSGFPLLEEAHRFAELVFPLLRSSWC